jgi:hypothetical protein
MGLELKAPVQMEDGRRCRWRMVASWREQHGRHRRSRQSPAGGSVYALLFDMWMSRTYPRIPFERYADDTICHCRSAEEARELWRALAGRYAQPVHPRLDQLLQPLLQDAVASNPDKDRCLCHSVGAPHVQADAPSDQRGTRLVCPFPPGEPASLRPLVLCHRNGRTSGAVRIERFLHGSRSARSEIPSGRLGKGRPRVPGFNTRICVRGPLDFGYQFNQPPRRRVANQNPLREVPSRGTPRITSRSLIYA